MLFRDRLPPEAGGVDQGLEFMPEEFSYGAHSPSADQQGSRNARAVVRLTRRSRSDRGAGGDRPSEEIEEWKIASFSDRMRSRGVCPVVRSSGGQHTDGRLISEAD